MRQYSVRIHMSLGDVLRKIVQSEGYIDRTRVYEGLVRESLIKSEYLLRLAYINNRQPHYAQIYFLTNIQIANRYRACVTTPGSLIYFDMCDIQRKYTLRFKHKLDLFRRLSTMGVENRDNVSAMLTNEI